MDIPKKIYQSWKTKNLTGKMAELVEKTKELNPEYEYELYDDNDCREFILKHFGENYANAFDILIPGAFKCDFWRYAKLYVDGGVYVDIDMVPLVPFREIIKPTDKFLSVSDLVNSMGVPGIFQSFVACVPKHPILKYSLELCFSNIVTRRSATGEALGITGPIVMGVAFNLFYNKKNTYTLTPPGVYGGGVRLLKTTRENTFSEDGKKLFQNKYSEYERGSGNYRLVSSYYKDDPWYAFSTILRVLLLIIIIVAILAVLFTFAYKSKWKKCKESCSTA